MCGVSVHFQLKGACALERHCGVGTSFYFGPGDLGQGFGSQLSAAYVLAVRDGDVLTIPEPDGYAMFLAGLGLLAAMRARSRSSQRRLSIWM